MSVGITFSCFDLFHAGHVAMLKEAHSQCDHMIVCLQTDPTNDRADKNKPIQSVFERYVQLEGCKYVDEIIPYATESEVLDILLTYHINKRFVGEELLDANYKSHHHCDEMLSVSQDALGQSEETHPKSYDTQLYFFLKNFV